MHMKKQLQFHGVDYIVVPRYLWEGAKGWTYDAADQGWESAMELCSKLNDYEEAGELTDE